MFRSFVNQKSMKLYVFLAQPKGGIMNNYMKRIDAILKEAELLVKEWANIENSESIDKLRECLNDIEADLLYDDTKCHMMISKGLISFAGNFFYKEPEKLIMALMVMYSALKYRADKTRDIPGNPGVSRTLVQIPILVKEMCAKKDGCVDPEYVKRIVGLFNSGMQDPSWGYRMNNQEINLIYQGIRISEGELLYHDYAVDVEAKVSLSSLEAVYAIGITYAKLYTYTITALWSHDSTGSWSPIGEWQTINGIATQLL